MRGGCQGHWRVGELARASADALAPPLLTPLRPVLGLQCVDAVSVLLQPQKYSELERKMVKRLCLSSQLKGGLFATVPDFFYDLDMMFRSERAPCPPPPS